MTKEKWLQCWTENMHKLEKDYVSMTSSPEQWTIYRNAVLRWVKNNDELTEIYNLENKVK